MRLIDWVAIAVLAAGFVGLPWVVYLLNRLVED
jgi:hypothetical protein